jgi:hypothetical protein
VAETRGYQHHAVSHGTLDASRVIAYLRCGVSRMQVNARFMRAAEAMQLEPALQLPAAGAALLVGAREAVWFHAVVQKELKAHLPRGSMVQ